MLRVIDIYSKYACFVKKKALQALMYFRKTCMSLGVNQTRSP